MLSLTVTKPVSDQRLEQQKTHILMVGTATYLVVQYIKKIKMTTFAVSSYSIFTQNQKSFRLVF